MANTKTKSNELLLYIDPAGGTSYKLIVCLEENSYNVAANEIDANSKCGPDIAIGIIDTTLSLSGQVIVDPAIGQVNDYNIETVLRAATKVGWKFSKATPEDGDVVRRGQGFFTSLEITAGLNDVVKFSAELKATGTVTVIQTS
jgi:hypothetical protein